jgi:hypothetical protein
LACTCDTTCASLGALAHATETASSAAHIAACQNLESLAFIFNSRFIADLVSLDAEWLDSSTKIR